MSFLIKTTLTCVLSLWCNLLFETRSIEFTALKQVLHHSVTGGTCFRGHVFTVADLENADRGGHETWNISCRAWQPSFLWLFLTGQGGARPLLAPPSWIRYWCTIEWGFTHGVEAALDQAGRVPLHVRKSLPDVGPDHLNDVRVVGTLPRVIRVRLHTVMRANLSTCSVLSATCDRSNQ